MIKEILAIFAAYEKGFFILDSESPRFSCRKLSLFFVGLVSSFFFFMYVMLLRIRGLRRESSS